VCATGAHCAVKFKKKNTLQDILSHFRHLLRELIDCPAGMYVISKILTNLILVNKLTLNNSRADIYQHYVQNFSSYLSGNTIRLHHRDELVRLG